MVDKANSIGTKFSDFTIIKILNKGKYGFIAKVKSNLDKNIYVMKRIDLNLITIDSLKKYYQIEYDTISLLNHENVYKALSKFKEEDTLNIITEYMDGGNLLDLFDLYKENNIYMDQKKLLKIFIQCLKGLEYIHEMGLIHRSIKHDNIIFDSNYNIKIINFKYSIEKNIKDKQVIKGALIAPEMEQGKEYDEKVDVYSMGMIFSSLAYLSSRKNPDNKANYSPLLYDNIKRMKSEKKDERPNSSEMFLEFNNIYYDAIRANRACLKCFVFFFGDNFEKQKKDLLELEPIRINDYLITKKIIALSKIQEFKSEKHIPPSEKFRENGFDMDNINPNEKTRFILDVMHNENKENKNVDEIMIDPNKDNNKIKKQKFEENYKIYIKNNKSLISDNFLVSYIITRACENCDKEINEYYSYENDLYININQDILNKAKTKFDTSEEKNRIIQYVFNVINEENLYKTDIKEKTCPNCKSENITISTKFYKLQNYLIFLCEPEIELNDEDKENLSSFIIGKEQVDSIEDNKTYKYKLISIIMKNDKVYDYYNRKPNKNMFTKNDEDYNAKSVKMYNLKEIKGKIVALYYYSNIQNEENKNINNSLFTDNTSNNNIYNDNRSVSAQSSFYVINHFIINNGENNKVEITNKVNIERKNNNTSPNNNNMNQNANISLNNNSQQRINNSTNNNNNIQNINNQNQNVKDQIINKVNETKDENNKNVKQNNFFKISILFNFYY